MRHIPLTIRTPLQRHLQTIDLIRKEVDELKRPFLAERIRMFLGPDAYLTHLDKMLSQIRTSESGASDLRDGLRNEDQFWKS